MPINYQLAHFDKAFGQAKQLPPSTFPEVVFAGRSNVGKSSLLNALLGRKKLAKVSSTPGKTATINFYEIQKFYYVDLPGYGYAQVSKSERASWADLINGYFEQKRRIAVVCSLVDIRIPPQKLDISMIEFLKDRELPFMVVLTKADKLSKTAQGNALVNLRAGLGVPEDIPMLATSSSNGDGIRKLRSTIEARVREC